MKITYTGTPQLNAVQQKKLDTRFVKLGKLLDRNGEKEAHVVLTAQRHLQRAEITVNYYNHPLVGLESNADTLLAMTGAIEKIEKQILRLREKYRDTKRTPEAKAWAGPKKASVPEKPAKPAKAEKPKTRAARQAPNGGGSVFRVNPAPGHKPMTLEEAMLEMDGEYMVYRDAGTGGLSVLVRRNDGNFDLIES